MFDSYANIAAITARNLVLSWPAGDNSTDTQFNGHHLNLTALQYWNFTYYANDTISNGSRCLLVMEPYQPAYVFPNGSFTNSSSCYSAIKTIGLRGSTGIGFAVAYGICLVILLSVLAKHGKLYLERETRFYPIGRRWQWYWGLWVCACALISLFSNIEVDRYYLQSLPITITIFFWYLMCMGTLAMTWEAVRHWGSWQERQFIDPNPFVYGMDDRRAKMEFWLPLWFYFWVWMNFFLVVPRSWSFPQMQRSDDQTASIAIPTATSIRFKIGAFFLVVALLTICFSLRHSINYYKDRNRGLLNRAVGLTKAIPLRFYLIIPFTAVLIAYQAFIAWEWKYSLVNVHAPVYVMFLWGYAPSLLIIIVQIIYGLASPNEDKELIRQRRVRGDTIDRELGITKKPAWWRRVKGEHLHTLRDKIAMNVHEIGGGRATGRRVEDAAAREADEQFKNADKEQDIEMYPVSSTAGVSVIKHEPIYLSSPYTGKSEKRRHERTMQVAASLLFPNSLEAERAHNREELAKDGPVAYSDRDERGRTNGRPGSARRSNSAETTNSITAPPQQIHSMLDI
ncbi:hypothetical protein BGZ63DRAFT_509617 [Mariannaea sp. PMI_226]|nr:hypothetical protein BGZ63DRAFT_509617 [Mariannaea sp. PMI_226]